jgi:hypothetical protein
MNSWRKVRHFLPFTSATIATLTAVSGEVTGGISKTADSVPSLRKFTRANYN